MARKEKGAPRRRTVSEKEGGREKEFRRRGYLDYNSYRHRPHWSRREQGGGERKTAGASGIIQMDTSDGGREGGREGGRKRNFLIERFRSRHCHAEQRRQAREGMEGKGTSASG